MEAKEGRHCVWAVISVQSTNRTYVKIVSLLNTASVCYVILRSRMWVICPGLLFLIFSCYAKQSLNLSWHILCNTSESWVIHLKLFSRCWSNHWTREFSGKFLITRPVNALGPVRPSCYWGAAGNASRGEGRGSELPTSPYPWFPVALPPLTSPLSLTFWKKKKRAILFMIDLPISPLP